MKAEVTRAVDGLRSFIHLKEKADFTFVSILTGCHAALLRLHGASLRTPMDRVTMETFLLRLQKLSSNSCLVNLFFFTVCFILLE